MDASYIKWHGFEGSNKWPLPALVAASDKACRKDQGNNIKANEYLDDKEVLMEKLKLVAQLLMKSKYTVAYTGAGLSRSSGIPDYASKAENSLVNTPKIKDSYAAEPTYAHCSITHMERAGLIHYYVQQNHDGLPQKSGFPQEKMNEIHGAWFDPSNPVVQFSESLRSDLFQKMAKAAKKTDLCLCLGTSLSGMNADRMANTPATKSMENPRRALGTIIINLQETPLDGKTCIRIWAKLDDAFKILLEMLDIKGPIIPLPVTIPDTGDLYVVGYNALGEKDKEKCIVLDLRDGAEIKIVAKGAMNENCEGRVTGKKNGQYVVVITEPKGRYQYRFGVWWVDAALRGAIYQLPFVNKNVDEFSREEKKLTEPNSHLALGNQVSTSSTQPQQIVKIPKFDIVQSHFTDNSEGETLHNWSLSLSEEAKDYITSVTWILHKTFPNPVQTKTEFPFKLKSTGWGTFRVNAEITTINKEVIKCGHDLEFLEEGNDVCRTSIVN